MFFSIIEREYINSFTIKKIYKVNYLSKFILKHARSKLQMLET